MIEHGTFLLHTRYVCLGDISSALSPTRKMSVTSEASCCFQVLENLDHRGARGCEKDSGHNRNGGETWRKPELWDFAMENSLPFFPIGNIYHPFEANIATYSP